jgi:hypothetical protein
LAEIGRVSFSIVVIDGDGMGERLLVCLDDDIAPLDGMLAGRRVEPDP